MKIVIAGANGFLGRSLAEYFGGQGNEIVGLVRRSSSAKSYRPVQWDGKSVGPWVEELERADALINLAGRSVNCRYGPRNRAAILESRTVTTRVLGDAVALCREPPAVWLNASTATIYRDAEDRPQDEASGELGSGFSVEVAKAWEKAFFGAPAPGTVRKAALRTALVLGSERGTVLDYLCGLARRRLGGTMGNGRQRVSWIHEHDFCRVVDWLIHRGECDGIVNVVAPEAVSNRELMAEVRRQEGIRWGLPATRWMLEVGAFFMRTEPELVLKSRWAIPRRLLGYGFSFHYPDLRGALADLLTDRTAREGARAKKPVRVK